MDHDAHRSDIRYWLTLREDELRKVYLEREEVTDRKDIRVQHTVRIGIMYRRFTYYMMTEYEKSQHILEMLWMSDGATDIRFS